MPRRVRLLLALLVLVAAYALLQSPVFRVAAVEVTGVLTLDPREVVAWAGLEGEPLQLWQVDPAAVERRLARHPRVEGARVRRVWPDRVVIELREREAVAYLVYHDRWLAVDADGRVIDLLDRPPPGGVLLEAPAPPDMRVGNHVPDPLLPAVRTAAFVRQYGLDWVEAVRVTGEAPAVELRLAGGVTAWFGSPLDRPERKLAVLHALWQEWAGRRQELAVVDVRDPERPVVRTR